MTPIKRYTNKKLQLTLDPFAFLLNSFALGDVIAAVPVIKYLVDNYYVTPESYTVVAKQQFKPFFPFVPDANFRDFDSKDAPLWGIPDGVPLGLFNAKNDARFVRNTPKAMHLSHYASLKFADSIIPLSELNYVPIEPVDVSRYNVDFTKAVVLVVSYRDETRSWPAKQILLLANWIKRQGLIPVFIGKTDTNEALKDSLKPKTNLPVNISKHGVDLRNQTSLVEMVSIMAQAKAVCGVDSGPIHAAGTTDTPIICGYPTVLPEYRTPTRAAKTYAITPEIECGNCESRWRTTYHNFEKCFFGHANCCNEFTADKYIAILKEIL